MSGPYRIGHATVARWREAIDELDDHVDQYGADRNVTDMLIASIELAIDDAGDPADHVFVDVYLNRAESEMLIGLEPTI